MGSHRPPSGAHGTQASFPEAPGGRAVLRGSSRDTDRGEGTQCGHLFPALGLCWPLRMPLGKLSLLSGDLKPGTRSVWVALGGSGLGSDFPWTRRTWTCLGHSFLPAALCSSCDSFREKGLSSSRWGELGTGWGYMDRCSRHGKQGHRGWEGRAPTVFSAAALWASHVHLGKVLGRHL